MSRVIARLVLILMVAGVALAATPSVAGAEVVWLCRPGEEPNPCRESQETTIYEADGSLAGGEPAAAGGPTHRLLLRLPDGQRPAGDEREQEQGRRGDRDRALPGRPLLRDLPRVRARLPPAHGRLDLHRHARAAGGGREDRLRRREGGVARVPPARQRRPRRCPDRTLPGRADAAPAHPASWSTATRRCAAAWCRPSCWAATCSSGRAGSTAGTSSTSRPAPTATRPDA